MRKKLKQKEKNPKPYAITDELNSNELHTGINLQQEFITSQNHNYLWGHETDKIFICSMHQ